MEQIRFAVIYHPTFAELRALALARVKRSAANPLMASLMGSVILLSHYPFLLTFVSLFVIIVAVEVGCVLVDPYRMAGREFSIEVSPAGVMLVRPDFREFVGWDSVRSITAVPAGVCVLRNSGRADYVPMSAFVDGGTVSDFVHIAKQMEAGLVGAAEPGVWPPSTACDFHAPETPRQRTVIEFAVLRYHDDCLTIGTRGVRIEMFFAILLATAILEFYTNRILASICLVACLPCLQLMLNPLIRTHINRSAGSIRCRFKSPRPLRELTAITIEESDDFLTIFASFSGAKVKILTFDSTDHTAAAWQCAREIAAFAGVPVEYVARR